MKKILLTILAILVIVGAVSACQPKDKDKGGESSAAESTEAPAPGSTADKTPDATKVPAPDEPFNGEDDLL